MATKAKRYIEEEAEASGDDYEKDSFLASEDDSDDDGSDAERSDESDAASDAESDAESEGPVAGKKTKRSIKPKGPKAKRARPGSGAGGAGGAPAKPRGGAAGGAGGPASSKGSVGTAAGIKVFSNKTIDESKVPPKPAGLSGAAGGAAARAKKQARPFDFRLTFTNGVLLRKFLEPAARAVKKMRFVICQAPAGSDAFTGFRIECHDSAFTLADRGMFECDVETGGAILTAKGPQGANGETFCVNADAFMEALLASTLKETDLRITKYTDGPEERITFESINNENDVRTVYSCGIVEASQVQSLDGITIELGFHVNVHMATLKELSLSAKRCGAPTLKFELWQAADLKDPAVVHSKMAIGFKGDNTNGSHDFFISTRKESKKGPDGTMRTVFTPLPESKGLEELDGLTLEKKCSNEYDNKKLRMFLNHMECQWALLHLCTDNTSQPLVLNCAIGGARTEHTVIVAPKETGE